MRSTHIFTPAGTGGTWAKLNDTRQARWYPTVLTLADGRALAASGSGATGVEIFDGSNWALVTGASRNFPELYPSLHQLPSGQVFYSPAGWAIADATVTRTACLTVRAQPPGRGRRRVSSSSTTARKARRCSRSTTP